MKSTIPHSKAPLEQSRREAERREITRTRMITRTTKFASVVDWDSKTR